MKLQQVLVSYSSGSQLTDIQDTLDQIKELYYLDCDDDEKLITNEEFKHSLIACVNQISADVRTEKILKVYNKYILLLYIILKYLFICC